MDFVRRVVADWQQQTEAALEGLKRPDFFACARGVNERRVCVENSRGI